jgi:hypothetical protein
MLQPIAHGFVAVIAARCVETVHAAFHVHGISIATALL